MTFASPNKAKPSTSKSPFRQNRLPEAHKMRRVPESQYWRLAALPELEFAAEKKEKPDEELINPISIEPSRGRPVKQRSKPRAKELLALPIETGTGLRDKGVF